MPTAHSNEADAAAAAGGPRAYTLADVESWKWTIVDRCVSDPTYVFGERAFETEAAAKEQFAIEQDRARRHGGSAKLLHGGAMMASFSYFAENE